MYICVCIFDKFSSLIFLKTKHYMKKIFFSIYFVESHSDDYHNFGNYVIIRILLFIRMFV